MYNIKRPNCLQPLEYIRRYLDPTVSTWRPTSKIRVNRSKLTMPNLEMQKFCDFYKKVSMPKEQRRWLYRQRLICVLLKWTRRPTRLWNRSNLISKSTRPTMLPLNAVFRHERIVIELLNKSYICKDPRRKREYLWFFFTRIGMFGENWMDSVECIIVRNWSVNGHRLITVSWRRERNRRFFIHVNFALKPKNETTFWLVAQLSVQFLFTSRVIWLPLRMLKDLLLTLLDCNTISK